MRKHATLVAVNLRGYMAIARSAAGPALCSFHAELVVQLMAAAARGKALTDGINGDRFYASVNGARASTGHRAAGAMLAYHAASTDVAPPLRAALWHGDGECPVSACGAACAGELLCGDLGCQGLLRYSFVGATASWIHITERLTTRWGFLAAVNATVQADVHTHFTFLLRAAGVLDKPGYSSEKPHLMYELKARKGEESVAEWMYQLQTAEAADPWAAFNTAMRALIKGDGTAAARCAEKACAAELSPGGDPAATELRAAWAELSRKAARDAGGRPAIVVEAHLHDGIDSAPAGATETSSSEVILHSPHAARADRCHLRAAHTAVSQLRPRSCSPGWEEEKLE